MWITGAHIHCKHGFSTRHGGISAPPYNSLNLGGSLDAFQNIETNRIRALQQFNLSIHDLCLLKQVHGTKVCEAFPGTQVGDALVTNNKTHILAISNADCYPILFYDDKNQVIGAAHAGWRGTVGGIAGATIEAMKKLGADPLQIKVAIGPGISKQRFEVGQEVIDEFRLHGFPEDCWTDHKIDLIKCNLHVLRQTNILDKNIHSLNRCTFENDFFSHRRDQGLTGRMWGIITMQ